MPVTVMPAGFLSPKTLQPVSVAHRNGLLYRGERIRTSDLLVPNQIQRLLKLVENERILHASN